MDKVIVMWPGSRLSHSSCVSKDAHRVITFIQDIRSCKVTSCIVYGYIEMPYKHKNLPEMKPTQIRIVAVSGGKELS